MTLGKCTCYLTLTVTCPPKLHVNMSVTMLRDQGHDSESTVSQEPIPTVKKNGKINRLSLSSVSVIGGVGKQLNVNKELWSP